MARRRTTPRFDLASRGGCNAALDTSDRGTLSVLTSLRADLGGPFGYRLAADAFNAPLPLGDLDTKIRTSGLAEGECFFYDVCSPEFGPKIGRILIWNVQPFSVVATLASEEFGRRVLFDLPRPEHRRNVESICLAEGHVLVGLATGDFQVYRIGSNAPIASARIGGTFGDIAASGNQVAVSLFPGPPGRRHERACGVKLYQLDDLLAGRFQAYDFISAHELGFIPFVVRFDGPGLNLLCCGSNIRSEQVCSNTVLAYELASRQSRVLLNEEDSGISHSLSNIADDGSFVLEGKEDVVWCDAAFNMLARRPRPEAARGGWAPCTVSPDAQCLFIGGRGQIHALTRDGRPVIPLSHLGRAHMLGFRGDGALVVLLERPESYALAAVDRKSFEIIETTENRPEVEQAALGAYDFALDGSLAVGDYSGHVRMFDSTMTPLACVPDGPGPVAQIVADPYVNRFAVLNGPGAVHTLSSERAGLVPYVTYFSKTPREAPSWVRQLVLSHWDKREYLLDFSTSTSYRYVHVDGVRTVDVDVAGDGFYRKMRIDQKNWDAGSWTHLAQCSVAAPVRGLARLPGKAAALLEDGTLLFVDPYSYVLTERKVDGVPEFDVAQCPHTVLDKMSFPRGLCAVGEDSLVAWNNERVALCRLGERFQVVDLRSTVARGVRNVKWDRAQNRLGVLHDTHLSIWSIDLQELFRLFVLRDGFYMVHVPHPPEVLDDSVPHHPGYFWTDHPDPLALWEVVDAHGRVITDERQRAAYLSHYFSKFMVDRALENYDRWRSDLHRARLGSPNPPLSMRLLTSGCLAGEELPCRGSGQASETAATDVELDGKQPPA